MRSRLEWSSLIRPVTSGASSCRCSRSISLSRFSIPTRPFSMDHSIGGRKSMLWISRSESKRGAGMEPLIVLVAADAGVERSVPGQRFENGHRLGRIALDEGPDRGAHPDVIIARRRRVGTRQAENRRQGKRPSPKRPLGDETCFHRLTTVNVGLRPKTSSKRSAFWAAFQTSIETW